MRQVLILGMLLTVFFFVSCSSGDSKKNDEELNDNALETDTDSTDKEIITDNETVDETSENKTETDSDDLSDDLSDEVLTDSDEVNDDDVSQECTAPAEISEFDTKPYARMRIYMNPAEFPDETNDDEYPDNDSYVEEIPEGVEYSFKAEYGEADWGSDSYNITAMVLPEFDEDEGGLKDYLFIEGTEATESESDIRWFMLMMDTAVLKEMKTNGINSSDIEENALLIIKRDTETETMKKSCLEAILKKGKVYACHDADSNYGIYEYLNLWFALELETDETTMLTEMEYDELCECNDLNGDSVDCETGDPL